MEVIWGHDFLFEQLPMDVNSILLKLIAPSEWIRLSCTSKRWLNNTKIITDFEIPSGFLYRPSVMRSALSSTYRSAEKEQNNQGIATLLARFNPEGLQRLHLFPDLRQSCKAVEDFITRCTRLRTLLCSNSVYLYEAVGKLTQLKHLHLDDRPTSGSELALMLKKLVNLETLKLTPANSRSKYIRTSEFYSDLPHLTELRVWNSSNIYIDYEYIGEMTQLRTLDLKRAFIKDEEFEFFSGLTNLEVLSLKYLKRMIPVDQRDMQRQVVFRPKIGNEDPLNGLRYLTSLAKLTYLDISNLESSKYDSEPSVVDLVELVQRHWTNLKTLEASYVPEVTGECWQRLKAIPGLTVIAKQGKDMEEDE